jgi:hypothetical protein
VPGPGGQRVERIDRATWMVAGTVVLGSVMSVVDHCDRGGRGPRLAHQPPQRDRSPGAGSPPYSRRGPAGDCRPPRRQRPAVVPANRARHRDRGQPRGHQPPGDRPCKDHRPGRHARIGLRRIALVTPLVHYIKALHRQCPDLTLTVILPEVVIRQPWHRALHGRPASRLKRALKPLRKIVVTTVLLHLPD